MRTCGRRSTLRWNKQRRRRFFGRLAAVAAAAAFILITHHTATPGDVDADVRFIADGELASSMVADIMDAETGITGAVYLATVSHRGAGPNDAILDALSHAARRGIAVSMVFDRGDEDDLTTRLNPKAAEILLDAGVHIRYDAPERLLHSKMLVIDGRITYIGSHNWTFSGLRKNRETSVRIVSEEIAEDARSWIETVR